MTGPDSVRPGKEACYRFVEVPDGTRATSSRVSVLAFVSSETHRKDAVFAVASLYHEAVLSRSYPDPDIARRHLGHQRCPARSFMTQNVGRASGGASPQYRLFGCDGLVCADHKCAPAKGNRAVMSDSVDLRHFGCGSGDPGRLSLLPMDQAA